MKTTKSLLRILTIALALAVQVEAQDFLTNGLVAYYPFNGNASDASGTGNNGTLVNGPAFSSGVVGQGIGFSGTGQLIEIPYTQKLIVSNYSIAAWVMPSSQLDGQNLIFGQSFGYPELFLDHGPFGLRVNTAFAFSAGADFKVLSSTTRVPTGEFSQFVGTWDGTALRLYVNGILNAEITSVEQPFDSGCAFSMGGFDSCGYVGQFFNGVMDEVRYYNRALSSNEVAQLYAYEAPPVVNLIKAVRPSFSNLTLTTNYQVQVSGDGITWTNQGSTFTATNKSMVYPEYFDVESWDRLFFRLEVGP